jgi:hypothetical protein
MLFRRQTRLKVVLLAAIAVGASYPMISAQANGWLEDRSWQFETSTDQANKAGITDLIERKKGGYYDSFKSTNIYNTTNTNTTNIDHQVNCSVTAASTGNTGANTMTGSASSPTVTNSSSNNSTTTANSASNGLDVGSPSGVVLSTSDPTNPNNVNNNQTNTGTLGSGVSGSSTSATSGQINANGGTTNQAINSSQSNDGSTQTASVVGSTACSLTSGAPLN